MGAIDIERAEIWEDTGCVCLARIQGGDGSNIAASDVSSFTRKVFDVASASPSSALDTQSTTTPSTSDIHALKTDNRWTKDETGYNFENTVGSSIFTRANRQYRIEYTFTPSSTSEAAYKAVFEAHTKDVRGS